MFGKLLKKAISKSPAGKTLLKHDKLGSALLGGSSKKAAPANPAPKATNPNSPQSVVSGNRRAVMPAETAGARSGVGRLQKSGLTKKFNKTR